MSTNIKTDADAANITPLIHPDCVKRPIGRPAASSTAESRMDKDKKLRDGRGFLFDIIIVRLDFPNKTIDDFSQIVVETNFNENTIAITSSRINVLDFKSERSFEFFAEPLVLKEELSKNPLRLKVMDTETVLGYGSIEWSEEFLSGLLECSGEMRLSFETELKECNGTKTGNIQAVVRLQPKCEEYEEDLSPDGKCRNANKEINPNDVLFVVEDDKNPCCCAQVGIIPASESDHDLQPKCLDLSSFRAVNSQSVNNTDILSPLDPACQKLKTVTNHYQKLIDAIMSKGGRKDACDDNCHNRKKDLFYTLPTDICLKSHIHPTSSDSYQMPIYCSSDNNAFAANNVTQTVHGGSSPVLVENEPMSMRHCPLCKENMTFLPKLAACPNCCYKPVPCFDDKPYNDTQTADQILNEFQNKFQTNDNQSSDTNLKNEQRKCRCTCKYGLNKPCAYCRIRKLCEHIFQPSLSTSNHEDVCESKSSDVHCASSSDNRPFLTRIFSELKDLYDIEEPKKKEFEPDEHCERELNKVLLKERKSPVRNEIYQEEQKQESEKGEEIDKPQKRSKRKKRSVKPASETAVKSRLYDYQLVRQKCSPQIGHKTCINGFAGRKNVPPNMGWLWNINNCGKWKPGSIRKPIKELMKYFLKDFPADTLLVSQYSYRKMSKLRNKNISPTTGLVQKPTLHIHKKNGEYIITMRPLKPLEVLKEVADPYENMKPIQFRIVKTPHLEERRKLKQCLKDMGFKKCTCHRPILFCYCRSFLDKKKLEYQCNKECTKRQMEPCCESLVLSDTSDSEAEFDFGVTPPVGVIKPERLIKSNMVNVGSQYNELDWNPVPLFPKPSNKYMQMYQCAVGERNVKHVTVVKGAGAKATDQVLRSGPNPRVIGGATYARGIKNIGKIAVVKGPGGKVVANVAPAARGGGDGFAKEKGAIKGATEAVILKNKYGGRGDSKNPTGQIEPKPKQKVDMLKYAMKVNKKLAKLSPAEIAAKRKEKLNLLRGVNPPLLCMVDRRGKPANPCAPSFPCGDIRIC